MVNRPVRVDDAAFFAAVGPDEGFRVAVSSVAFEPPVEVLGGKSEG